MAVWASLNRKVVKEDVTISEFSDEAEEKHEILKNSWSTGRYSKVWSSEHETREMTVKVAFDAWNILVYLSTLRFIIF
jgi:hypothetical protein